MASINWTSQALNDVQAIGDFIARDAPAFAQVFVDKIFDTVERLESFPRSGRIVPEINQDRFREIIIGSYRVVYLLDDNTVNILTVFPASRLLKLPNAQGDTE